MTILIGEDEEPAFELLKEALYRYDPGINLCGRVRGVGELRRWLYEHPEPDLILLDIRLYDGVSLDAVRASHIGCPIIFTTAYDTYVLEALECNGIDYLLKPIRQEKLAQSLNKYRKFRQHARSESTTTGNNTGATGHYRERILVKKGTGYVPLRTTELSYFYTEHKVVFAVHRNGSRYIVDRPLQVLANELDPAEFFRANRKYLVQIEAVVRFSSGDHGKLLVELNPAAPDEVLVSQERSAAFKTWLGR